MTENLWEQERKSLLYSKIKEYQQEGYDLSESKSLAKRVFDHASFLLCETAKLRNCESANRACELDEVNLRNCEPSLRARRSESILPPVRQRMSLAVAPGHQAERRCTHQISWSTWHARL